MNLRKSWRLAFCVAVLAIILLACGNGTEPPEEPDYDTAKECALELVGDPDANVGSNQWNGKYYVATGEYNDGLNTFSVNFTLEPCAETE